MYAVTPAAALHWRALIGSIFARADQPVRFIDHEAPAPIEALWQRHDMGAVFMCGLPFSSAAPQPALVAAPVPSPPEFGAQARYWSDFVVADGSPHRSVADTFGGRIALTVPGSQSGCIAALSHFISVDAAAPLFREVISPTVTPLGALEAVADGRADVAPIDAYALRLLERHRPELTSRIRIVGLTAATPIPPLVASRPPTAALRDAFVRAPLDVSTATLMDELLLCRFVPATPQAYDMLRRNRDAAVAYWRSRSFAVTVHPAFHPVFG